MVKELSNNLFIYEFKRFKDFKEIVDKYERFEFDKSDFEESENSESENSESENSESEIKKKIIEKEEIKKKKIKDKELMSEEDKAIEEILDKGIVDHPTDINIPFKVLSKMYKNNDFKKKLIFIIKKIMEFLVLKQKTM